MPLKLRFLLAHLVSALPVNALRVLLYRVLLGYRIRRSRVGWRTVIVADRVELDGCSIAHHNRFVGPITVVVREGAEIGPRNHFECGWWVLARREEAGYDPRIEIGERALVNHSHYFNLAGAITIGRETWIGGIGSQFWTHGPGTKKRAIRIGERCYVGSHTLFAPGSGLGDNTMVALGSLVSHRFHRPNLVVGGVPAIVLREDFDWRSHEAIPGEDEPGEPAAAPEAPPAV